MAIAAAIVCVPLYIRIRVLSAEGYAVDFSLLRRGFSYASRAYLVALFAFLVLRVNTFIVDVYTDAEGLGIWSISVQIIDLLTILPSAVGLVLLPRILRSSAPYSMMLGSLFFVSVAMAIAIAALVLFGGYLIVFLYGQEYAVSYDVLLWGLPGSFSIALLTVVSQFLAAVGIPWRLIFIWAFGLCVEVVAALLLVPALGAKGGMAAFSIAHVLIFALVWWLAKVEKKSNPETVPLNDISL